MVCGDVRQMNRQPANAGALFQVASQFNLLEMTGPAVTPEEGVTRYQGDPTQGPACANRCRDGDDLQELLCSSWGQLRTDSKAPARRTGRRW